MSQHQLVGAPKRGKGVPSDLQTTGLSVTPLSLFLPGANFLGPIGELEPMHVPIMSSCCSHLVVLSWAMDVLSMPALFVQNPDDHQVLHQWPRGWCYTLAGWGWWWELQLWIGLVLLAHTLTTSA